jgi:hypothetical protein
LSERNSAVISGWEYCKFNNITLTDCHYSDTVIFITTVQYAFFYALFHPLNKKRKKITRRTASALLIIC